MSEPAVTFEPLPEPDVSHLVTEDDTPVDNIVSEKQMRLLTHTLYASWKTERPFVALANVGLFFSNLEPAVVPDVMVSLDVHAPRRQEEAWEKKHRSYMIWVYGKPPDIAIEIVSNRSGEEEEKARRYALIGVAYYALFDPDGYLSERPLRVYELHGRRYIELLDPSWLPYLGLGLVLWEGEFERMPGLWLRWCDEQGNLLPTGEEAAEQERQRAEQERQRAEQERQRAEQERQRAERLAARLRELGIEE
jgi:Uma2 family endonuclease